MSSTYGEVQCTGTALLVCDMQERFRPAVSHFNEITQVVQRLTQAAKILDVPLYVTEQYPQGLGKTVAELDIEHAAGVYPKTKFSMLIPEIESKLFHGTDKIKRVILCGVETHVCILQTTIGFMKAGVDVHVVADAVSSRSHTDRMLALERIRQIGGFVTTSESILLQLIGDKDHPKFKEIQKLIRELPPDTNLLNKL